VFFSRAVSSSPRHPPLLGSTPIVRGALQDSRACSAPSIFFFLSDLSGKFPHSTLSSRFFSPLQPPLLSEWLAGVLKAYTPIGGSLFFVARPLFQRSLFSFSRRSATKIQTTQRNFQKLRSDWRSSPLPKSFVVHSFLPFVFPCRQYISLYDVGP